MISFHIQSHCSSLEVASGILTPVRRIRCSRRCVRGSGSLMPIRRPHALRNSAGTNSASTSRHIRIAILVINWFLTNSRGIGGIRGSEIGGSLVGRERIGLFSSKLGVTGGPGLALPEPALGRTGSVAVVGGGAKGFLFPVVAHEGDLDEEGEEEEDAVFISSSFVLGRR